MLAATDAKVSRVKLTTNSAPCQMSSVSLAIRAESSIHSPNSPSYVIALFHSSPRLTTLTSGWSPHKIPGDLSKHITTG
ncbi:hypothetical protein FGIG_08345 [Fasciola gigantica]|uniref:Uncharacterized protein n=1 Tax=Fasciola gigantica TaxID=46835 RepID=A0A504YAX8_FASGI|nr:hypothetical protein FGIG_08345 [Fasciola gigantica]